MPINRFSFIIGFLKDTTVNGSVVYRDVTSEIVYDPSFALSLGIQGEEELFDLEAPNCAFTLNKDFTLPDLDGYAVRQYSPVLIYCYIDGFKTKLRFSGYVNPDGIGVDNTIQDFPSTSILATNYLSFFKEMKLGNYNARYRVFNGASDKDVGEAFSLYIKPTRVLAPGVTEEQIAGQDREDFSVDAEIAITPELYHTPGAVLPEDKLLFKKVHLYDSRMLTDSPDLHTWYSGQEGQAAGRWLTTTYNGYTGVWIRYLAPENGFFPPLYYTTYKSLMQIMGNCCDAATNWFRDFQFLNAPWPRFILENTEADFPKIAVEGSVDINLGNVYHYRYVEVGGLGFLVVWHTQWQIEIFTVTNGTAVSSVGTITVPEQVDLSINHGDIHGTNNFESVYSYQPYFDYYGIFRGENHYNLYYDITEVGNRVPVRTLPSENSSQTIHPDYKVITNVNLINNNRYIYIIWAVSRANLVGRVIIRTLPTGEEIVVIDGDLDAIATTEFIIVRFDSTNNEIQSTVGDTYEESIRRRIDFLPRTPTIVYDQSAESRAAQRDYWNTPGNLIYFIPKTLSSDTNFRDLSSWGFQQQRYIDTIGTPDVGIAGVETWSQNYTESTPGEGFAQLSNLINGIYSRSKFHLLYSGDVTLDSIKFSFENKTASDMINLCCKLTNSFPVITFGVDHLGIKLVPRDNPGGTVRTLKTSGGELISRTRQTFRHVNREIAPDISLDGLELSPEHEEIANRFYQDKYYLKVFSKNPIVIPLFDNDAPSWAQDVQNGDRLILGITEGNPSKGENLGVIEHISVRELELHLQTRKD